MMHIYSSLYKCGKSSQSVAKVSHEINKIPTCPKFFFPDLACISANYIKQLEKIVIHLSSDFDKNFGDEGVVNLRHLYGIVDG